MDEIETLLNNLGEEQMKDILADAARTHPDILEAIKEAGFREVRLDHSKKGVAYVEYNTDAEATVAMASLQHFKITPETPILITFAKKV